MGFALRYHTKYVAFWIDDWTKERPRRGIADFAGRLLHDWLSERIIGYLQEKSPTTDGSVNETLKWLCPPSNNQWLLIVENVDREFGAFSGDPL